MLSTLLAIVFGSSPSIDGTAGEMRESVTAVELLRSDWATRLNEFTAAHAGWLISLQVVGAGTQPGVAVEQMPLLGISVEDRETAARITISLARARSTRDHVAHVIEGVTRVLVYLTAEGAEAALRFDSAAGGSTTLRLRVAVLPERVDHVWHA